MNRIQLTSNEMCSCQAGAVALVSMPGQCSMAKPRTQRPKSAIAAKTDGQTDSRWWLPEGARHARSERVEKVTLLVLALCGVAAIFLAF